MSNFHNNGSQEWQSLALPGQGRGRGNARTRESRALEAELRALLARLAPADVAGCWIDWRSASREAVWIPAPGSGGEAA
jgi:hypothetical protein